MTEDKRLDMYSICVEAPFRGGTGRNTAMLCLHCTAEAENIALSSAAQESVWLRRLSTELEHVLSHPTTIYEDN